MALHTLCPGVARLCHERGRLQRHRPFIVSTKPDGHLTAAIQHYCNPLSPRFVALSKGDALRYAMSRPLTNRCRTLRSASTRRWVSFQ
jgi:hypothetical protein